MDSGRAIAPGSHDRGMLRLDPAHPPLWRTPTTLQFGTDPVAIVVEPRPWQERLIRELEKGIPDAALDLVASALGAPAGAAQLFVRRIARALAPQADAVARRVIVQVPDDFAPERVDDFAEAVADAGFDVSLRAWRGLGGPWDAEGCPALVLAHRLVDPRRVAALMSGDVVHLPVVFSGAGVELGPLVRPGSSACLSCLAAHRRDRDGSWPVLAAQLIGRPAPPLGRAAALEAGLAAAAMLNDAAQTSEAVESHSVTLSVGSMHRTTRTHEPHAECRCRSLSGTSTATSPAIRVPTTTRAYALPA